MLVDTDTEPCEKSFNCKYESEVIACRRIEGWTFCQPSLKLPSHREPNFEIVQDISESDVCMKYEQNLLRMKKVVACKITGQMDRWMDGQTE